MVEELPCKLELSNLENRFAVAVVHSEVTVGHVPKEFVIHFAARRENFL